LIEEEKNQAIARALAQAMLNPVQEALAQSNLTRDDDSTAVLTWWRNYKQDGVSLFKNAVRCVMSIPAGSSLSETSVSHTTRDVTKLRNSLGDTTLEMLTVIQSFLIHGGNFDFDKFFEHIQMLVDQAQPKEKQAEEMIPK